jgi:formylglycine-generating enzyme required for sulfatase activity
LFFAGYAFCQVDSLKKKADTTRTSPSQNIPANSVNVLFATNADCDLFINDEWKGTVLKKDFLYLKLVPGSYQYRAKSKATVDELRDSFTVSANAVNEVFLDLLYFIDERVTQIKVGPQKDKSLVLTATRNQKNPTGYKALYDSIFSNPDVKAGMINQLLGTMVFVKGGRFLMGSSQSPLANEAEHPVTIDSIFICRYEITQHQWQTIMGYNPSINKGCPTCPVEYVSWNEVQSFIQKLNDAGNVTFRLPTEAEWEYVAKAGGKAEIEEAGGQEQYIKKTAWYFNNAGKKTQPVGRRLPNVAGVFDLTGNVSEWCQDWYGAAYYNEATSDNNPTGPLSGTEKVLRGGNFKEYIGDRFRPSIRNKKLPTYRGSELGFRIVMDAAE